MVVEEVIPVSSKLLKVADALSGGEDGLPRRTSSLPALDLFDLTSLSSFFTASN